MDKYRLIYSEELVKEFLDLLPDENEDEIYYLSLFARKKYCPELIWSNDKTQLKRLTSRKKDIIKKIKQLEIDYGLYDLNSRIVPQESLVIYIHPNPRSQLKAARVLMKKLTDIICDNSKGFNVYQEALSALQKSKSKGYFIDFDIDTDKSTFDANEMVYRFINEEAVTLIETRGGYHVLIEVAKIDEKYKNTFYKNLKLYSDVEGDCFIPIPGTIQGGFNVKIIKDA
jgi:hypothetical protein